MDHGISTIEAPGKNGCVLILRWHDRTNSIKAFEVLGGCQGDHRSTGREGGIGDDPLLAFFDPGQARIFNTPNLFGK